MNKRKQRSQRISTRKLVANQQNAKKSTGPHNSNLSRYNAEKHGLLSEGVSEMDEPEEFVGRLSDFMTELAPEGAAEIWLVNRIALLFTRLRRAALIEAEFITHSLNPTVTEYHHHDEGVDLLLMKYGGTTVTVDAGLPARLSLADVESLQVIQRYETAIETKLYRTLNQLERLQRMRRGDKLPAPASLDVSVHREDE